MRRNLAWFCLTALIAWHSGSSSIAAAPNPYLPQDVRYDPAIPTPADYLGFQIGDRHLEHHQLVGYLKLLADATPRIRLVEYARSYGGRPLIYLVITAPEHQRQWESIQQRHQALCDPQRSESVDLEPLPMVMNMGYSVHGNEASAGNAAPLVAYYLAAAQGAAIDQLLQNVVVVLDPCLNPDGFERFAHWVNSHRGQHPSADPADREHSEPWPSGRTNYYWFDLNRDWLPVQHPESRGRLEHFHRWKPNIVLDFHEMGSDSTFFFQPGVPTRNHPLTPRTTFELTRQIAQYHARQLDEAGSLYFTEEQFDDFYMGKGSTYPDLHGAIGILFEQGSARGHIQDTDNGPLTFAYAIRNQFLVSLSSLKAAHELRLPLLEHQRDFYRNALASAADSPVQGYLVAAPNDPLRMQEFLSILHRHQIKVYRPANHMTADGRVFRKDDAYLVPAQQAEFRFLTSLMERRQTFEENIFYDISTWTLPLAFNLDYAELKESLDESSLGEQVVPAGEGTTTGDVAGPALEFQDQDLAYLIDWRGFAAPRTLYQLLEAGALVKVATQPLEADTNNGRQSLPYGTLMVPLGVQPELTDKIQQILKAAAAQDGVTVHSTPTGLTPVGSDLGSNNFRTLTRPQILLVVGEGVSSYGAGEIWHLFDQRYRIPLTKVDASRFGRIDLRPYTCLILVDGQYDQLTAQKQRLESWIRDGGTLIACGSSVSWAASAGLAEATLRSTASNEEAEPPQRRPYAEAGRDRALQLISGSIFQTQVDNTHPIGYGLGNRLPVFRNHRLFLEPAQNAYATPILYTPQPLLSGYVAEDNLKLIAGSASVIVDSKGSGTIILMVDEPNFRAFWYGTNRLLMNGVFFGSVMR